MRIISGIYKGRVIKAPSGNVTHPMSEKIRGAIFNALGDIKGLHFLDAFSGSGALAIEAVSRGAKSVIAIDNSKNAIRVMKENVDALNIHNIKVTQANVSSWIENNKSVYFDIVICDPPFEKVDLKLLNKLEGRVKHNGIFILSLPPQVIIASKLELLQEKDYNDAKLYFYRKNYST